MSPHNELKNYKRFRLLSNRMGADFNRKIGKSALRKGAKALGLLQRGILVFRSEDEMSVLFDFCIHTHRIGKKRFIDWYLDHVAPPPDSDEMQILEAIRQAHFSLMLISGSDGNGACYATDIIRRQKVILMDVGLAHTAPQVESEFLMAMRVLPIPMSDRLMTSGLAIPLFTADILDEIKHVVVNYKSSIEAGGLSETQEISFSKQVLRAAMRLGCLDQVKFDKQGVRNA